MTGVIAQRQSARDLSVRSEVRIHLASASKLLFTGRWLHVAAADHVIREPTGAALRRLPFQIDQRSVTLAHRHDVLTGQFPLLAARLAEHDQSEVGPGEAVPGR